MNNKKKMQNRELTKKKFFVGLQTAGAIVVTLIMMFPLYWMFVTALKSGNEVVSIVPTFWPKELQWSNFVDAWVAVDFPKYIWNTLFVTGCNMLVQTVVGVLAAYGFARGDFPCKNLLFLVVLSALMIPAQLVFAPIYVMIANLDLVDTIAGIVLPNTVSAYMIFMLRQNFLSVDQSYLDAGKVDGLGILGTIWHILIPMCKASVITTSLVSFINGWNNYFWPKMITKTEASRTIAVGVQQLKNTFAGQEVSNYNEIMAGAVMAIIPIVLLFFFLQKYIMTGMSKAAMK